jgi:hypothetical protein
VVSQTAQGLGPAVAVSLRWITPRSRTSGIDEERAVIEDPRASDGR